MATTAPDSLTGAAGSGIRQILSDELRPYPGRTATVARMVAACTITTLIVMTFRIPLAFLGIFYAFVISRQTPEWLLRNGLAAVAASAAAVLYVAAGVQLFYDYDVLHFVFLAFTLYLVFYLKRALTNDGVTFGFGVTATVALTLIWDRPYPAGAHLASTFSLSFVVALGTLVSMAVAWVALQLDRSGNARATRARQPLLLRDAFSNPEYTSFGLKGCLAGLLCYVLDSSVAWPVIMGACAEICIVSARPSSAGAGTRNERLFISVAALILGGVVFGFGSYGLLLRSVDSISGFLLQFAVITTLAAWVATSSPRLSYAGTLGAMGFFFPMVTGFAPNAPLAQSGAFFADLLLALLAFWLVLDRPSDRTASAETKQLA
ncbi:MAG: hypothetical protein JOZ32_12520 [Bryobacterales bacterium]|nr:hypothetical protein [Bryobacterales bacterium]